MFRRLMSLACTGGLLLGGVGYATTLGSLAARSMLGIDIATTVSTPAVIGCDNFTGTTGATMVARAATAAAACSNRVWTSLRGTWTIQSNKAASSATASAVVTEDTLTANSTGQVVLSSLNTTGRSAGLVLSYDGVNSYLAAVLISGSPNRAELRIVLSGTPTVLATATPAITASNTLSLSRSGSTVTVTVDGNTLITNTLSAPNVTSLGSGTRAGLFGGDANVRFDDFLVTSP